MKRTTLLSILLLIIYNCQKFTIRNEEFKSYVETVDLNKDKKNCPLNHFEFYNSFIFYTHDDIEQKKELRAKHYPASNERRIDLYYPFIKNLGGGYLGVGTDQNLTFIAWAKSEYAYLMDFDWAVVYINRLHLLFLKNSNDFFEFKEYWSTKNKNKALSFIDKQILDVEEKKKYLYAYNIGVNAISNRFRDFEFMTKRFNFISFHNNPEDFQYLKKMIEENRIFPVQGDMNGEVTFQNINQASRKLCIPIRVIYFSNAEEYFRYPETFKKNIKTIFYDDKTIILRTVTTGAKEFGYPEGEKYLEIPFHYNVQSITNLVEWFELKNLQIYNMLKYKEDVERGFSILNRTPFEVKLIQTLNR